MVGELTFDQPIAFAAAAALVLYLIIAMRRWRYREVVATYAFVWERIGKERTPRKPSTTLRLIGTALIACLLFGALIMSAAQPRWVEASKSTELPLDLVLYIDNGPASMAYLPGSTIDSPSLVLDRLKARAEEFAEKLRAEDELSIAYSLKGKPIIVRGARHALATLKEIEPDFQRDDDWPSSMRKSLRVLPRREGARKTLVAITPLEYLKLELDASWTLLRDQVEVPGDDTRVLAADYDPDAQSVGITYSGSNPVARFDDGSDASDLVNASSQNELTISTRLPQGKESLLLEFESEDFDPVPGNNGISVKGRIQPRFVIDVHDSDASNDGELIELLMLELAPEGTNAFRRGELVKSGDQVLEVCAGSTSHRNCNRVYLATTTSGQSIAPKRYSEQAYSLALTLPASLNGVEAYRVVDIKGPLALSPLASGDDSWIPILSIGEDVVAAWRPSGKDDNGMDSNDLYLGCSADGVLFEIPELVLMLRRWLQMLAVVESLDIEIQPFVKLGEDIVYPPGPEGELVVWSPYDESRERHQIPASDKKRIVKADGPYSYDFQGTFDQRSVIISHEVRWLPDLNEIPLTTRAAAPADLAFLDAPIVVDPPVDDDLPRWLLIAALILLALEWALSVLGVIR